MKRLLYLTTHVGLLAIYFLATPYNSEAQTVPNSSIVVDGSLGPESSHLDFDNQVTLISGGARRGTSQFHSFSEFNVLNGKSAYFNPGTGIDNIITRVTGRNGSDISGILGIKNSSANLFFINPNGIMFGKDAKLELGGSFLASTADSLIFDDKFAFSASDPKAPPQLLTINTPTGLRFGEYPGSIQSSAKTLELLPTKTIGLIGGEVSIHGTNLDGTTYDPATINSIDGKIEIGSLTGGSLINLDLSSTWIFDYRNVTGYQKISLENASVLAYSKDYTSSGIQFSAKEIEVVKSTIGTLNEGITESISGGNISLYSSEIFQINNSNLIASAAYLSSGKTGDITISANSLDIISNSFIDTSSQSITGSIGNIRITAKDIKVDASQLTSQSFAQGDAGNIKLTTSRLVLQNGGKVTTGTVSSSGVSGNIDIEASELIEITGSNPAFERPSGLFASSNNESNGNAGTLTIKTGKLNISDGGKVSVTSEGTGSAGNLKIISGEIFLNNGFIEASTTGGQGDINIFNVGTIKLAGDSRISTSATGSANGGNITIYTSVLNALPTTTPNGNGSDIVAKAGEGNGGNITINAQDIFGIESRPADPENQTNDIDASSNVGLPGQVQINASVDVNQGLVELPTTVLDPNTIISQQPCDRRWNSSFTLNGRGGTPPTPQQDLSPEAVQVGLVEAIPTQQQGAIKPQVAPATSTVMQKFTEKPIVPAQGWVYNNKQQVVLVAYNPTLTAQQRLQQNPVCTATE